MQLILSRSNLMMKRSSWYGLKSKMNLFRIGNDEGNWIYYYKPSQPKKKDMQYNKIEPSWPSWFPLRFLSINPSIIGTREYSYYIFIQL
jgi:hypothetical protein